MDNKKTKKLFVISIILIAIFSSVYMVIDSQQKHAKPIMYGSYSCPHCIHQKELINSNEYEYIECNIGSNNKQAEACVKADVRVYPTWVFKDNLKVEGVITQEQFEGYIYGK